MKTNLFLIVLFTFCINISYSQNIEQKAFDYFFSNIFPNEYSGIDKISFDGNIKRKITSFGHYKPCFDVELFSDYNTSDTLNKLTNTNVNIDKIREIKFRRSKSRYSLYVMKANKRDNFYFVQIELTKRNEFTDAYYIKIDSSNTVIEWCKTGDVW